MLRGWRAAKVLLQHTGSHGQPSSGQVPSLSQAAHKACSTSLPAVSGARSYALSTTTGSNGSTGIAAVTRTLLVDTLELMRRFERIGLTGNQAEALTNHVTELICLNKEKISEQFVSKAALERAVLEQEAKVAGFKSEVVKAQELHLASLMRDTERLTSNLGQIRSEIRYEVEKLTASQRLDLNLEKGRMRDELQALRDKSNELEIKMDKETNGLKAAVEQVKNESIKYCLSLMLAFSAAGLGAARLLR